MSCNARRHGQRMLSLGGAALLLAGCLPEPAYEVVDCWRLTPEEMAEVAAAGACQDAFASYRRPVFPQPILVAAGVGTAARYDGNARSSAPRPPSGGGAPGGTTPEPPPSPAPDRTPPTEPTPSPRSPSEPAPEPTPPSVKTDDVQKKESPKKDKGGKDKGKGGKKGKGK